MGQSKSSVGAFPGGSKTGGGQGGGERKRKVCNYTRTGWEEKESQVQPRGRAARGGNFFGGTYLSTSSALSSLRVSRVVGRGGESEGYRDRNCGAVSPPSRACADLGVSSFLGARPALSSLGARVFAEPLAASATAAPEEDDAPSSRCDESRSTSGFAGSGVSVGGAACGP